MKEHKEEFQTNLKSWDSVVPIHESSDFYDVEGFKAGKCSLSEIEKEEVGNLNDKSLLHLQCHFGMDTLSWARRGATVTGVDFSPKAVELAKSLAENLNIDANFICSNLYEVESKLNQEFDVVFTSQGALCWLPNIKKWGRIAARYIKPGGFLYVYEGHPILDIFESDGDIDSYDVRYNYFQDTGQRWESEGTYADRDADIKNVTYQWTHPLSSIINALISAGLVIEFVHEFPFNFYPHFSFLKEDDKGRWWPKDDEHKIPMSFSIKASKPV